MATLLLNASYEPLRVISTRRAVVLVLQEKAEILEESEDVYHSASTAVPVPAVIKLKYFVQVPYRARIPLSNAAVLRRDRHECCYCTKRRGTTVDHVMPRARGGKHEWENVVAACSKCNAAKADKTIEELRWEMRFKPYVPHGTKWLLVGMKESAAWEPYLVTVGA